MTPDLQDLIERGAAASHAGTISFGDLVATLAANGVESYRADFRTRTTTYYMPAGDTFRLAMKTPPVAVAERFDDEAITQAIRGAQRGEVHYPEFVRRAMEAGCVGYAVWIAGKHVTYWGRRGESHVERFPGQPS